MAEKKTAKCANPGCNCPAAKRSKYCGAYCEGSASRPSMARCALPRTPVVRARSPSEKQFSYFGELVREDSD